MRETGEPTHDAVRRTLALNTLQAGALMALAALSGVVVLARGAGQTALIMALCWAVAVPAAIAAAGYLTGGSWRERLTRAPDPPARPSTWYPRPWLRWALGKGRQAFADTMGAVVLVRRGRSTRAGTRGASSATRSSGSATSSSSGSRCARSG
jgi:hypothetical protein